MFNAETGRLLTPAEAAEYLRVSRHTVYRAIERGELVALKVGRAPKAQLRIRAGELERFLRVAKSGHPCPERRPEAAA